MTITYAREPGLDAVDYILVLGNTTMRSRRPLANPARIQKMLDGANFIVSAREDGELVGLARCITDFAWICYCAELAVREDHQGKGVGKQLLETCAELLGPGIGIALAADPEAIGFYERLGMQPFSGFMRPRSNRD